MTTITISREQHALATERIKPAGLEDRVEVLLRDYREIEGHFDAIVSIEMLEAVGAEFFETYFETCDRVLKPGGMMSLQSIAFPDVAYLPQARGANWIQTYIFPGRPAPVPRPDRTLAARHAPARPTSRGHRVALRAHACRLAERFMSRLDDVRAMGFDDRFIRMWEYYLAISEAGFDTGVCQDLQIVLEKGRAMRPRPTAAG